MIRSHRVFFGITGLVLIAAATQAAQAAQYTVTKLSNRPGNVDATAFAINTSGQVAGSTADSPTYGTAPFLATKGVFSPLDGTVYPTGQAQGLNDFGQVVGAYNVTGGNHAFYSYNGALTDLGTLGGTLSIAYGINNAATIVGYASLSSSSPRHAFSYSSNTMHDLGTLGGIESGAYGINDSGKIVGWSSITGNAHVHAFSYTNSVMTDLGLLSGTTDSYAYGINTAGTIVGASTTSSASKAFQYANGVMTDLGSLNGTGGAAYGLNDTGDIVGWSQVPANQGERHGFLIHNGVMSDLNSAINPALGLTFTQAYDINNNGSIVGNAIKGTATGFHIAVLLTPNVTITGVPAAPNNLVALPVSPSEIDVRWFPVPGATSYRIYRATTSGGPYTRIGIVSDITNFNDVNLADNTSYYYVITAVDSEGQSPISAEFTAKTPIAIPATPTNLTATALSASQIKLDWAPTPKATSYGVYQAETVYDDHGTITLWIKIGTVTSPTFTVSGLQSSTSYSFEVIAVNDSGQSATGAYVTTTTKPGIPALITGLTTKSLSASQIQLSWTGVNGATSYAIFRSLTSGGTRVSIGTSTATTFTDTNLSANTLYYYTVKAVNSFGQSPESSVAYGRTWVAAPTNLKAVAVSATQINLTWNAVAGATSYQVYLATASGTTYYPLSSVNAAAAPSYSQTNCSSSTTYYYVVSAIGPEGETKSTVVGCTTPAGIPALPSFSVKTISSSQIDLTITPVSGATGYRLYRGTVHNQSHAYIGSTSTLKYSDTGLTPSTVYYYVAVAVNSYGSSPATGEIAAVTLAPPVTNLTAVAVNQGRINLSWTAVPNAIDYKIYRRTISGGTQDVLVQTTLTAYSDTGVAANTTYYYAVMAITPTIDGEKSVEVHATTNIPNPPLNVIATPVSKSQINLIWTAGAGATSYQIYRGTVQGGLHSYVSTSATTSYHDTQRTPNTTYYYIVIGVNANGSSQKSNEASAKTPAS